MTTSPTSIAPSDSAGIGEQNYIRVAEVTYAYPGAADFALKDISLFVGQGEFACIVGPSGCGKSTLLNLLTGLACPDSGDIWLGGMQVAGPGVSAGVRRPRLGYLFQDARLLPWRTVRVNIELALRGAAVPKADWDERVHRYLRLCEIEEYVDSWPGQLSGGQRQRAAIARAMAIEPACVLMDEPFSALDEVTARSLRRKLLEVWASTGQTIIFITHSIREAVFLADDVYVMAPGPGRVLEKVKIGLPRPRRYEDPAIAEIEGDMVSRVLGYWGFEGEE